MPMIPPITRPALSGMAPGRSSGPLITGVSRHITGNKTNPNAARLFRMMAFLAF
jgi:hypothetical protein